MAIKKDVTVYIGRFNPFHMGHAHVLEQALKTSKMVIVLVGSSGQARSPRNPFSFEERKSMIEQWALTATKSECTLKILPIRDYPYSNNQWLADVQSRVKDTVKRHCLSMAAINAPVLLTDIYLTGSDRDDTTWYLKSFPQWKLDLVPAYEHKPGWPSDVSGSSVRTVMYESQLRDIDFAEIQHKLPKTTLSFLKDFAKTPDMETLRVWQKYIDKYKADWAVAPYEPSFICADAVVIQSGHILVTVRGHQPGIGLWALPGGFVKSHMTFKETAIAEVIEETGIRLAEGKRAKEMTEAMLEGSIKASQLFDAPKRSDRGRTATTAYLMRLNDQKSLPKVSGQNAPLEDTGGVEGVVETLHSMWVPLDQALRQSWRWFEDHHAIVEWGYAQKDA